MPEAIIQGENHLNSKDFERLLDDADQAEALYVEGRDGDDAISYWPPSYLLFFAGSLLLSLLYLISSLVGTITNRGPKKKQKARNRNLNIHSDIDLSLREMYAEVSTPARFGCFVGTLGYFTFVAGYFVVVVVVDPSFSLLYEALGLFFLIVTPFVYLVLIVRFALPQTDARNQKMAKSIVENTGEEGYDNILILVGDNHVPYVASHLRDAGWDVTERQSSDSTMRAWRKIGSILPSR